MRDDSVGHAGAQTHAEVFSWVISRGSMGEMLIGATPSMPRMMHNCVDSISTNVAGLYSFGAIASHCTLSTLELVRQYVRLVTNEIQSWHLRYL